MPGSSPRTSLPAAMFGMLALALAAAGCTAAANDAPIIDYVESPLVVSARNGAYEIPISIGFHDNDQEVVTHVRYRVAPSFEAVVDIEAPISTRQSADVTLKFPAASCKGEQRQRALEITIIDSRGAESRVLPRSITLE